MKKIYYSEISLSDNRWQKLILESKTATFFQSPSWLSLWVKHFGNKEKIKTLGIYDSEKLIGIAPFYINNGKINFLSVPDVSEKNSLSDFGDIVAVEGRERKVWKAVLKNISREGSQQATPPERQNGFLRGEHLVEFNYIREDSPSFGILKDLGGKVKQIDVAPYIDLPNTWDEYLAHLSRKDRHELRRKIRKLEREGAFKVCLEGDSWDENELFRLMRLSSYEKENFLSKEMEEFFTDLLSKFLSGKSACLCFLKLNGENIAVALSFIYRNDILLYNSGFDPKYSNLAPGLILKAYLIKHAIEKGMRRFDFLRGGERYKFDLGGKERKLYKVSFELSD